MSKELFLQEQIDNSNERIYQLQKQLRELLESRRRNIQTRIVLIKQLLAMLTKNPDRAQIDYGEIAKYEVELAEAEQELKEIVNECQKLNDKQDTTMKKIETRTVEYYGVEIEIPANHNFVAMDKGGEVYSYEYKPTFADESIVWTPQSNDAEYVSNYLNKDCNWKESLREYPSLKPSTGEPKSKRAKQFAEWFDEMFTDVDVGNPSFAHTDPYAVLAYVKEQAGKNNTEVRKAVIKHIDEYTVPQYGDYPNDNVEKWSKQYCIDMVAKYKAREGTSQRSEGNLDYWKMMHYSQLADCKPDDRAGDSMIAELLLAFKAVTSTMTPDGVLVINGLDAKGTWHGLEFDYRDWLLSGQTEMQAKLELANRIVQWVDEIKKEG